MGTVTYPHGGVERRLRQDFVAYKPQIDLNKDLAKRFAVIWTPTFLFLDPEETVHHRSTGYHPPEMFEHLLDTGRGMIEINSGRFENAVKIFTSVVGDDQASPVTPEALYWLGVSRYKMGDKEGMIRSWNDLLDEFPDSLWSPKVSFIRKKALDAARAK